MKRSIAVFVLALCLVGAMVHVHNVYAAKPASATWQSSEAPEIQLGVRDKYGDLGSYKAEFVVVGQKGGSFRTTKKVNGDEWAFVVFPQDFGSYAEPGRYTWKCLVNGKTAVTGKFELSTGGVKITAR